MPRDRVRDSKEKQFEEKVVSINRVTKVVKGGRRFRFAAIVVIGDKKGKVGFGTGKAQEVPDAIKKAIETAKNQLITVPVVNNTIPHAVIGKFGAGQVVLRPASEGTGIIAGGAVRAIFELAGVNDILAKSVGTSTPINMIRATFSGLSELRTADQIAKMRGLDKERLVKWK